MHGRGYPGYFDTGQRRLAVNGYRVRRTHHVIGIESEADTNYNENCTKALLEIMI